MQSDGQSLRNFRLQKPCDNWPRLITNWSITPKIFPNGFPNQSLFPYFRSSISHSSILSETIFQSFILAGRTPHSLNLEPETSKFAKTKKKPKKIKTSQSKLDEWEYSNVVWNMSDNILVFEGTNGGTFSDLVWELIKIEIIRINS